jgi:DNA-binding MarR family transcriptional regulator
MEDVREGTKTVGAMAIEKEFLELETHAETLDKLLFELSWVSHRQLEQELDVFHLTVPQYIALKCIRQSATGHSMSQLARSSHQVSATMTGIVDRLLDRGLVVRERDLNDRRTLRVHLTSAGRQLLEQVQQRKRAWLLQFLATLSEEERKMMIEMALRYLNFLEKSLTPVSPYLGDME